VKYQKSLWKSTIIFFLKGSEGILLLKKKEKNLCTPSKVKMTNELCGKDFF
jgi:hypothetical protein